MSHRGSATLCTGSVRPCIKPSGARIKGKKRRPVLMAISLRIPVRVFVRCISITSSCTHSLEEQTRCLPIKPIQEHEAWSSPKSKTVCFSTQRVRTDCSRSREKKKNGWLATKREYDLKTARPPINRPISNPVRRPYAASKRAVSTNWSSFDKIVKNTPI